MRSGVPSANSRLSRENGSMSGSLATGTVISLNVGVPRVVRFRGRDIKTAIWKEPAEGPLAFRGVNVAGDDQADRTVHGGHDKAVYAYSVEDYSWWSDELGQDIGPGTFGDNLTTSGIDVSGAVVGERWRVGSAVLEVAQPRTPCFKLGIRMGNNQRFPRRFSLARRPGAYLRIVEEGQAQAGDAIEVVLRPSHGLTVRDVATITYDGKGRAAELLNAPELPETYREWAGKALRS